MRSFLLVFILVFIPHFSDALTITEIMYNPEGSDSGHEWIEVYNEKNSVIDITDDIRLLKIRDESGVEDRHIIQPGENNNVCGGEIIILAQNIDTFRSDYSEYSGKVFKSSFNLRNSKSNTIKIIDTAGDIVMDSLSYNPDVDDGDGDGYSLHKDDDNVYSNSPNPGYLPNGNKPNVNECVDSNEESSEFENVKNTELSNTVNKNVESIAIRNSDDSRKVHKIKRGVIILDDKLLTNLTYKISINLYNQDDEIIRKVNSKINFGNGMEVKGREVRYAYLLPGKYVVNANAESYDFLISKVVSVERPNFDIKNEDGYISIINNHDFQIDISDWSIVNNIGDTIFELPENSVILANEKINIAKANIKNIITNKVGFVLPRGVNAVRNKGEVIEEIEPVKKENVENTINAPNVEDIKEIESLKKVDEYTEKEEVISKPKQTLNNKMILEEESEEFLPIFIWILLLIILILIPLTPLIISSKFKGDEAGKKKEKNIKKISDEIKIE